MSRECSISGCDRPHCARGLCNSHYARRARGQVVEGAIKQKWEVLRDMLLMRDRSLGCWDEAFTTATNGDYPVIKWQGRSTPIGQVVLVFEGHARPTPKHEVLHSCDNKLCFNPLHIRWGTRRENVVEAIERGLRPQNSRRAKT